MSRLVGSPRGGGLCRFAALAVATAAGAGFAPVAPGTFGSLVGVGVFALIAPHLYVPHTRVDNLVLIGLHKVAMNT